MLLAEFIKTFQGKKFKLDKINESILEFIYKIEKKAKDKEHWIRGYRSYGKTLELDYFARVSLSSMKKGETFALLGRDGVRVFRLEKIIEPKIQGKNESVMITDEMNLDQTKQY